MDEALPPEPPPAALGTRVLAGAFDFAVLWVLVAASFLVPMFTRGMVLPMWGVLLVMLGYQVVPLSAFRQTLGMRLFGLELVTRSGHAVGAGEVLFRELIGRGFFPAAFLGTLLLALIASLLHVAAFIMPTGVGGIFFLVSAFTVALAVLGHFLVFNRTDGRTLADVIARSYVTPVKPRPPPDDAEEAAFTKSLDRKRTRNVVLFEVVCVGLVFFGPWLLTQRTESTQQHAERLKLRAQEDKAKAYPDDMLVIKELWDLQRAQGLAEQAAATQQRWEALKEKQDEARVDALKKLLAGDPTNRRTAGTLLDLLEERGRRDEAKAVYLAYVDAAGSPSLRAGYARWLSERGWHEEAIAQMKQSLTAEPEMSEGHTLLASIYEAADQKPLAHDEFYLATRQDPEDEEAADGLARLDQDLGALSRAAKLALDKPAGAADAKKPGAKR